MASLDFEKEKQAFREFYTDKHDLLESAKDAFLAIINSIISHEFSIAAVIGRVKSREECIKKFCLKYQTKIEESQTPYEIKDHISDLIGLRVICLYESDIHKIKDVLNSEFELLGITDKISSIEAKEDAFGYKGLHVDLKLKEPRNSMREYISYADFKFEVQIRTIIQDAWSVLDHKIKYKKSIPLPMKRRINTLAALFELADREFYSIKKETDDISERMKANPADFADIVLDAFSFLPIVEEVFPEYTFKSFKVDGFVSEIISYNKITPIDFKKILTEKFDTVEKYKNFLSIHREKPHSLNPYTEIRHALFLSDNVKYQKMLYNDQRTRFEEWLQSQQE